LQKPHLAEIVKTLHEAGMPPQFDADQSRVLLEVWQLVANGQSVTPEQLNEIGSKHKISLDEANSFISGAAEYDDDGNIVGIFGLSQKKHPHRFRLRGYSMSTATFHVHARLSTWCAWDSLFLPSLLKETAEVESTCPQTKDNIRLRISPERVEQYEPANAVLSLVLPKPTKGGTKSAGEIWELFCHHVFFFSSAEALAEWFKGSDHKPIMLSVEEGYQLGRLAFADILKYVQKPDEIT